MGLDNAVYNTRFLAVAKSTTMHGTEVFFPTEKWNINHHYV